MTDFMDIRNSEGYWTLVTGKTDQKALDHTQWWCMVLMIFITFVFQLLQQISLNFIKIKYLFSNFFFSAMTRFCHSRHCEYPYHPQLPDWILWFFCLKFFTGSPLFLVQSSKAQNVFWCGFLSKNQFTHGTYLDCHELLHICISAPFPRLLPSLHCHSSASSPSPCLEGSPLCVYRSRALITRPGHNYFPLHFSHCTPIDNSTPLFVAFCTFECLAPWG